jgi:2-aminoadipate transaminase
MRLNFAGNNEGEIREGVRRIGEIMGGETGLFGALTGAARKPRTPRSATKRGETQRRDGVAGAKPAEDTAAGAAGEELADVVELPRRRKASPGRRSSR